MITIIQQKKTTFGHRLFSCLLTFTFLVSSIVPPQGAQAQTVLNLPIPGAMVPLSPAYHPAMIKGINIDPTNPLQMDFIIDSGDTHLKGQDFDQEATKLIKYFLSSLTLKEEEMWVNLSPYEKDRMIPEAFGHTEMGRDLLIQDYLLKQLTASLIYPEDDLGKKFWERVYAKAQEQFGTTEIPMNTFNKIWIIPETAEVFEHEKGAFVVSSHLKVMLEEDYVAMEHYKKSGQSSAVSHQLSEKKLTTESRELKADNLELSDQILREIIVPAIEQEVNTGTTFANLRQIFNSMILATWYKQNLKESLLSQVYVNQNKIKGVELDDPSINTQIYDQYVEAFKKGVYNYIKEDVDPNTQEMIPRKYFSGGVATEQLHRVVEDGTMSQGTAASPISLSDLGKLGEENIVTVKLEPEGDGAGELKGVTEAASPVVNEANDGIYSQTIDEFRKIRAELKMAIDQERLTVQLVREAIEVMQHYDDPSWTSDTKLDDMIEMISPLLYNLRKRVSIREIAKKNESQTVYHNVMAGVSEGEGLTRIESARRIEQNKKNEGGFGFQWQKLERYNEFHLKKVIGKSVWTHSSDIWIAPHDPFLIIRINGNFIDDRDFYVVRDEVMRLYKHFPKTEDSFKAYVLDVVLFLLGIDIISIGNDFGKDFNIKNPWAIQSISINSDAGNFNLGPEVSKNQGDPASSPVEEVGTSRTTYRKNTYPNRNFDIMKIITSVLFRDRFGIDLASGKKKVVVFGVGAIPYDGIEAAQYLRSINPEIEIIGTEADSSVAQAYISSPRMLAEFREEIAGITRIPVGKILDLKLAINRDNQVAEALVGFEATKRFKGDGGIHYHTLAVGEGIRYVVGGEKLEAENKRSALLEKFINFLGRDQITELIRSSGDTTNTQGASIEFDPIKSALEKSNAKFRYSEELGKNDLTDIDIFIANFVIDHMQLPERRDFLNRRIRSALSDGGVAILKSASYSHPDIITFYQRRNHELMLNRKGILGSSRVLLDGYGERGNPVALDIQDSIFAVHVELREGKIISLRRQANDLGQRKRIPLVARFNSQLLPKLRVLKSNIRITDREFLREAEVMYQAFLDELIEVNGEKGPGASASSPVEPNKNGEVTIHQDREYQIKIESELITKIYEGRDAEFVREVQGLGYDFAELISNMVHFGHVVNFQSNSLYPMMVEIYPKIAGRWNKLKEALEVVQDSLTTENMVPEETLTFITALGRLRAILDVKMFPNIDTRAMPSQLEKNSEVAQKPYYVLAGLADALRYFKFMHEDPNNSREYIFLDHSRFVESYLNQLREIFNLGNQVQIVRADILKYLYSTESIGTILLSNAGAYIKNILPQWFVHLVEGIAPGGEIIVRYPFLRGERANQHILHALGNQGLQEEWGYFDDSGRFIPNESDFDGMLSAHVFKKEGIASSPVDNRGKREVMASTLKGLDLANHIVDFMSEKKITSHRDGKAYQLKARFDAKKYQVYVALLDEETGMLSTDVMRFKILREKISNISVDLRRVSFSQSKNKINLTQQGLGTQIGKIFSESLSVGTKIEGMVNNQHLRRDLFLSLDLDDRDTVFDIEGREVVDKPTSQIRDGEVSIAQIMSERLTYAYVGESDIQYHGKTGLKALVALLKAAEDNMVPIFFHTTVKVDTTSSPVTDEYVGGIDLNPNNLDLQTQGGRFDLKFPFDSIDPQNIHIDGLTPVIINVAPLVNLPLLLGLVDEESDAPKNANHTPKRDPVNHKEENYLKVSSLN